MRKTLGTIALLVLLYIGFFGIRINDYRVQPFIVNWLTSNVDRADDGEKE